MFHKMISLFCFYQYMSGEGFIMQKMENRTGQEIGILTDWQPEKGSVLAVLPESKPDYGHL